MEIFLFAVSHDLLIRMSWKFTFFYSKLAVGEAQKIPNHSHCIRARLGNVNSEVFLSRRSRYLQDSSLQLSASTISLGCRWCGSAYWGGCSSLRQAGEWWKALDMSPLAWLPLFNNCNQMRIALWRGLTCHMWLCQPANLAATYTGNWFRVWHNRSSKFKIQTTSDGPWL